MKVLIAGAGPTGLTAGLELVRRGVKTEIIDRRESGSSLSRAVGINPRSLKILEPSGATQTLLKQGAKYQSFRFYRQNKLWVDLPIRPRKVQYGYDFMLGLAQDKTEAILREAFIGLGGVLNYGTELVHVRQNANQVIVDTAGGSEIQCDYLIGADGVRSATRESLGIQQQGIELAGTWSIADVNIEDFPHYNSASIFYIKRGIMLLIVPLGGPRFRVVSNTENTLATLPLALKISRIRREGQFTVTVKQVTDYMQGRVFLAGDAAHCHSPVGGRGMNLGIADAADLAARLTSKNPEESLSGYSKDRHQDAKRVIEGSERMRKIVTSDNPLTRSFVLAGLKLVSVVPPLQRKLFSMLLYG